MFVQRETFLTYCQKYQLKYSYSSVQAWPIFVNFPKANVLGRHLLRLEKIDTEKYFPLEYEALLVSSCRSRMIKEA